MKLFFSEDINKNIIHLKDEEAKHCLKVNRFKKHDEIKIIDGKGYLYTGIIINDTITNCTIEIKNKKKKKRSTNYLHLAITPLKNTSKFEFFLQKATEIGIDEITPVITDFSEKKTINMKRCMKIVISSIKQANNYFMPRINQPESFNDFIKNNNKNTYICHCKKSENKIILNNIKNSKTNILIGPEGGFSINEINTALQAKIQEISISKNILRTETAGILCCAIIKS